MPREFARQTATKIRSAQFFGDVPFRLAALRLLETGIVTERARELAQLLGQPREHRERRKVAFLELGDVVVNFLLDRRKAHR